MEKRSGTHNVGVLAGQVNSNCAANRLAVEELLNLALEQVIALSITRMDDLRPEFVRGMDAPKHGQARTARRCVYLQAVASRFMQRWWSRAVITFF